MSARHRDQTIAEGIHSAVAYLYANAAARTGATGFVAADLYKMALQTDDDSVWLLSSTTPTWTEVSATVIAAAVNKVEVSIRKGTAGTLNVGDVVYPTGYDVGNALSLCERARSDSPTTMPALGMVSVAATDSVTGKLMVLGFIDGLNTAACPVRAPLYLSDATAGAFTPVAPDGPSIVQPVGVCLRQDAALGRVGVKTLSFRDLSDVVPLALGTAAQGTANLAARQDHVHPHGAQAGGTAHANAVSAGAAGFMSGADKAALDNATVLTASAPANVTKAASVVGVAADAARADHKHDITTAAATAASIGQANGEGAATTLARSDHTHAHTAPAAPANVTKAAASAGVATTFARSDHKHDVTTVAAGAITIGAAAAEGASTSLARADHVHSLASPAAPVAVGTANATGAASAPARQDHVHDHGAQTTATHHAAATGGANGFMSSADKTKLDGLVAGAGTFGAGFQTANSSTPATTTSSTPIQYMSMTTPSLPAGTYRIGWNYAWNLSSVSQNFLARVQVDNSQTILSHEQEPQDVASSQRNQVAGFAYVTFGSAGTHDIDIDFWSSASATAGIANGTLEIWRVA